MKNYMKINKTILLAALGLCAVSANAAWTITGNGGDVTTAPGHSGSYTFTVIGSSDLGPGNYNLGPTTFGSIPSPSNVTSFSGTPTPTTVNLYTAFIPGPPPIPLPGVYTSTPFSLTVSWFVPLTATPNPTGYSFNVFLGSTPVGGGSTLVDQVGNIIVIVPAPEPAQTLAGGMLLGCGGLIFAGRRIFKKQSA